MSERTYTDEELDRMNAEENTPMEFEGKKYTKYEALQKQRRLETAMRAKRQDIHLLKEGGADEEDIIAARCRYRVISGEYTRFSEAMGLPQQRERVTVDGLGNIGVGKYKKTLKNAVGKPIIEVKGSNVRLLGEPNTITQTVNRKGGISRNYYDDTGRQFKQISNNHHEHRAVMGYGKNGEHAHDYVYDDNGHLLERPHRELTEKERKENADIL